VVCSITATVYYGGECTQKYISHPVTVSDEIVPLESLPPLQWSICKQIYLTDCTVSQIWDMWTNDYTNTGFFIDLIRMLYNIHII
jgi:hypothetical protein